MLLLFFIFRVSSEQDGFPSTVTGENTVFKEAAADKDKFTLNEAKKQKFVENPEQLIENIIDDNDNEPDPNPFSPNSAISSQESIKSSENEIPVPDYKEITTEKSIMLTESLTKTDHTQIPCLKMTPPAVSEPTMAIDSEEELDIKSDLFESEDAYSSSSSDSNEGINELSSSTLISNLPLESAPHLDSTEIIKKVDESPPEKIDYESMIKEDLEAVRDDEKFDGEIFKDEPESHKLIEPVRPVVPTEAFTPYPKPAAAKFTIINVSSDEISCRGRDHIYVTISKNFSGLIYCKFNDKIVVGTKTNSNTALFTVPRMPAGSVNISISFDRNKWTSEYQIMAVDDSDRVSRLFLCGIILIVIAVIALAAKSLWRKGNRRRRLEKLRNRQTSPLVLNSVAVDSSMKSFKKRGEGVNIV